jgi:A/G-specific adenine glycosylase
MEINELLISWYLQNKRSLPWRDTNDPYIIWLSEVILQQTRVEQGLSYFLKFSDTYPDVKTLAKADEQDVLKMWQGLGYYSRARNLLNTARLVASYHHGAFPDTYDGLLGLKGIGPYTAAAIASFAYKLPHAVVDGNVMRVLSRVFNLSEPVNSTMGKKIVDQLAAACLSKTNPDIYNQSIMELGAMICTPANPDCPGCPLNIKCEAFAKKTVALRPVKIKKQKATVRHIHYAVIETEADIVFRRRGEKDIWQGLHDFPSVETMEEPGAEYLKQFVKESFPKGKLALAPQSPERSYKHLLTHRRIEARFWRFRMVGNVATNSLYLSIPKKEIGKLAVPRLIHKFLEDAELI